LDCDNVGGDCTDNRVGTGPMKFQRATKKAAKLRAAVYGPSGSGKTFSSLRIATGLADNGRIAVIDTERGSASKYADRFDFDVLDLERHDVDAYVAAIRAASGAGYSVLIIDSLSHAWQSLLEQVDKLAKSKYRGNSWSAWSEGTPRHKALIDALLSYPGHVIVTMRSKTEWATSDAGGGKSKPTKVGLAPEQRAGVEYEFDLLLELSVEHVATVSKDRTGRYQDQIIDRPGEDLGRDLLDWLGSGVAPAPAPEIIDVAAGDPDLEPESAPEPQASEPQTQPTLEGVIAAIEAAADESALAKVAGPASKLSKEERAEARAAFRKRAAALKAAAQKPQPEPPWDTVAASADAENVWRMREPGEEG